MSDVPSNFTIYNHKLPKGWSHPIQSSDIISAIAVPADMNVGIGYGNTLSDSLYHGIFSITYRGSHNKYLNDTEHKWNQVYFGVEPIQSKFRRSTRELFQTEILPFAAAWLKAKIEAGVQVDAQLIVDYNWSYRNRCGMVVVSERGLRKTIFDRGCTIREYKHQMEVKDEHIALESNP